MTYYTIAEIIRDVRIVLGHNDLSTAIDELTSDVDTLTLDEIIRRELRPAARELLLVAPKERMEWEYYGGSLAGQTNATERVKNPGCFELELPSDFLRLGSAKMKSWAYPQSETVSVEELAYKKQFSEYNGLKATTKRPLMAIVETVGSGGNFFALQMFGCLKGTSSGTSITSEDSLTYATICRTPKCYKKLKTESGVTVGDPDEVVSDAGEITNNSWYLEYSEGLYQPFLYMCASLVAKTLKYADLSTSLLTTANNLMIDIEATRRAVRLYSNTNKSLNNISGN